MGHRRDRGDAREERQVLRPRTEVVVAAHQAVGLAAEDAELIRIHQPVEARLGDFWGIIEVDGQRLLGDVEYLDLDVLAEVDLVDGELEATPG